MWYSFRGIATLMFCDVIQGNPGRPLVGFTKQSEILVISSLLSIAKAYVKATGMLTKCACRSHCTVSPSAWTSWMNA